MTSQLIIQTLRNFALSLDVIANYFYIQILFSKELCDNVCGSYKVISNQTSKSNLHIQP